MHSILKQLYSSDYVEVTYFDILTNTYRTIQAIPSEINATHLFENAFGDDMWKSGGVISLSER